MFKLRPVHQGISVEDIEKSIQWYQEVLGFKPVSREYVPFLDATIAFLESDGFQIELFEYHGNDKQKIPSQRLQPAEDIRTCGTKHVAYGVDDLSAVMRHLEKHSADIAQPVVTMGDDLVLFIRDINGVLIELIEQGGAKKSP